MEDNPTISPKKRKMEGDAVTAGDGQTQPTKSAFENFETVSVLNENSQRKMICVEGKYKDSDDRAVVIVEKTPLSVEIASKMLSDQSNTEVILQNDIYGTHHLFPKSELNALKATVIYPATEKHIAKYRAQDMFLVKETANDYQNITRPFLESEKFSIQWVYNILEKKSEADRIVFEDPDAETGFILLPDMKWNESQIEDLYLVAIVHKHGIRSIRELDTFHLPLLKKILENGTAAVQEKYGVGANKLRIYFHYQPSYYHLHVHFTHLKYDAPGSGVEKAHLLSDVIENIEMDPNYYQKKTLYFMVKENEGLFKKFQEAGKI